MSYGIEDIESLSTLEGFRQRVQMYLGSNDLDGAYQAFKEILNNATDEYLAGYGNTITIKFDEDNNRITVIDEGRGIPFGIRKETGENVLVSVFTGLHVGGKFNHKNYANSSGLNGVGGSAVCGTSKEFVVKSYRDGVRATAAFKEGVNTSYKEEKCTHKNGTEVSFIPDPTVFKIGDISYSFVTLCEMVESASYFNKGCTFVVTDEKNKVTKKYYSKNGIADFIEKVIEKPIMKKPITVTSCDLEDEVEVSFMWSTGSSQSYVFVNGLQCPEKGTPDTGAKTALTKQMKKLSKQEFDSELIRKGLVYAINCKVKNPSFANQTKSKINNPNLRTLASQAFSSALEQFAKTPEFDLVVNMLTKLQRAEVAADKARKAIMETGKEIEKAQSKKVFNSDKLKDAEFLGENSTLLICEGDSALGGMTQARDYKKYGVLALRGKTINCFSNDDERIADNDEVKLILKALGIVPGKYNSKKLRYGRVAICVDSDSDGQHIALLILTVLFYLAPEFVKENRMYWLHAPLYIVTEGKKETYYFSDEEFNAVRATVKGEVTRAKGLGEMSPETAHNSMFVESTQRLEPLPYDTKAIELLQNLMGEDVEFRKEFIMNNIDFSTIKE